MGENSKIPQLKVEGRKYFRGTTHIDVLSLKVHIQLNQR